MSFRRCRCHTCSSKYAASSTSQQSILASAAFRVLAWPATMISLDWLSPTGGFSRTVGLPSRRACAISLAGASIADSLSHLSVTLLCPSWSMNFAALFCNPGKLSSASWNQHRPRHLESPFTGDQHKRHLFFRFPVSKEPIIH